MLRTLLLAGSQSAWLRNQATRRAFVRRAVSRFMPGETVEEALAAAAALGAQGLGTILTHLGENVTARAETDAVVAHYLDLLGRIRAAGLDAEVSVKLTQLGLDFDAPLASAHTARIAAQAAALGVRVWIDMESSPYVDRTLDAYRALRPAHPNLGIALQTYLRRTAADLETLMPLAPIVRLVKGAYREPAAIAFPDKRDVDATFETLAHRLLADEARRAGAWVTLGTHDLALTAHLAAYADSAGIARDAYEFAMLYGIQREEQLRLARAGYRSRVLISYGSHWFPWYMRRLAERPANLMFVLKNLGRR